MHPAHTLNFTRSDKDERVLAEHEAIRVLGKRVFRDIVEIGERLTDAKQRVGAWAVAALA